MILVYIQQGRKTAGFFEIRNCSQVTTDLTTDAVTNKSARFLPRQL